MQKRRELKRLVYAEDVLANIDRDRAYMSDVGRIHARAAVNDAPTVDAVEAVHCKECKYWADGVAGCTDHVKCCKIGFYMVGENGYCVYGERRTDNERKAD